MVVKSRSWVQLAEAAKYFDVSCLVIRTWISDGRLVAAHLPTGHVRILARDVMKVLLELGKPLPPELGDLAHKHVLMIDPDHRAGGTMAAALREASGCKVTLAASSSEARGLLGAFRPDLVVLAVRRPPATSSANGQDMLILADVRDDLPAENADRPIALRVGEILPVSLDDKQLVARVGVSLLS